MKYLIKYVRTVRAETRTQGKLSIQRKYITCNNLGGRGLGWNKLILEEMMLSEFSLHGLSISPCKLGKEGFAERKEVVVGI